MGAITSANVANAIVKLVAADALPALMGNLVMGNLVNRDYEATLAQAGDTVNVPIPPTLTAHNIAEGDTVATFCLLRLTHTGTFMGIAPTGKTVECQFLAMNRVVDGMVVQHNSEVGWLSVLRQPLPNGGRPVVNRGIANIIRGNLVSG